METKKRMGRPPLPKGEGRTALVTLRFTKAELKVLKAKARAEKTTVASLLRRAGGFEA